MRNITQVDTTKLVKSSIKIGFTTSDNNSNISCLNNIINLDYCKKIASAKKHLHFFCCKSKEKPKKLQNRRLIQGTLFEEVISLKSTLRCTVVLLHASVTRVRTAIKRYVNIPYYTLIKKQRLHSHDLNNRGIVGVYKYTFANPYIGGANVK